MSALFFFVRSLREESRFSTGVSTSLIFVSNEFSRISLRFPLYSFFIELSNSLSRLELSVLLNFVLSKVLSVTVWLEVRTLEGRVLAVGNGLPNRLFYFETLFLRLGEQLCDLLCLGGSIDLFK